MVSKSKGRIQLGASKLICSNYIRFEQLQPMTLSAFANSPYASAQELYVFIDLNSALAPLFDDRYNPEMDESETEIAACIINMVAHYRRFFWRRLHVKTKFFLVFSYNCPQSARMEFPAYNSDTSYMIGKKSKIMDKINTNLELVRLLLKYVNDATLIVTNGFDTATYMYYLLQEYVPNDMASILITKDRCTMQIAGTSDKDVYIYRPKKYKGEDISELITPNDLFFYLCASSNTASSALEYGCNIDKGFYSFVLAATNCKERGYKACLSIRQCFQELSNMISKGDIPNRYSIDCDYIIEHMGTTARNKCFSESVNKRFKAIDANRHVSNLLYHPERYLFNGFENLYDPNGFHAIINEYFSKTPLDVENL